MNGFEAFSTQKPKFVNKIIIFDNLYNDSWHIVPIWATYICGWGLSAWQCHVFIWQPFDVSSNRETALNYNIKLQENRTTYTL